MLFLSFTSLLNSILIGCQIFQPYLILHLLLFTFSGSHISKLMLVLSLGSVSYTAVPPGSLHV